MTRKEKISALTKRELEWFLSNGDGWLKDFTDFFADGGFHNFTDEQLDEKIMLNAEEDAPTIHILDGRTLGQNEEFIR